MIQTESLYENKILYFHRSEVVVEWGWETGWDSVWALCLLLKQAGGQGSTAALQAGLAVPSFRKPRTDSGWTGKAWRPRPWDTEISSLEQIQFLPCLEIIPSLQEILFEPTGRERLLSCNFLWFEIWHLQASRVGSLRKNNNKGVYLLNLAEYPVIFNSNSPSQSIFFL